MIDTLIRGAHIADGTGKMLFPADVAIVGDKVTEIGNIKGRAKDVIEADGLILSPGFVDVHTHYDAQLTWDKFASPSPALGTTTVVIGNCGFSIAPCPPEQRNTISRNLAEVEGMSISALEAGIDWSFESFKDYLGMLEYKGTYPNVACFVGHSAVRTAVLGSEASEREATSDEISIMRRMVKEAMAHGAMGFSSSSSLNHNGANGVPMPSRLACKEEFRNLVGVLGELGRGVFQLTVGPHVDISFLEELASKNNCVVMMTAALHNEAFPDRAKGMLEGALEAQSHGVKLWAQVSCQPLSMDFSLLSAFPFQPLESWKSLAEKDKESLFKDLGSSDFRDKFKRELLSPTRGKIFYGDWSKVSIAHVVKERNLKFEGLTIRELSELNGIHPVDAILDLALDEALETVFNAALLNSDESVVGNFLKHDAGLISLSDAGAHLRYMCDAGYGLHLLGHWVREKNVLPLEDAIRRLTSLPADLFSIRDRGRLSPGMFADLLLFDKDKVDIGPLHRVNDLPNGETRMLRDPIGVRGVWVNGQMVFNGKQYIDIPSPGKLLRSW